jgi:hypothetical protein
MCKGFRIRLSRETKSFFSERLLLGKTKRITIRAREVPCVTKVARAQGRAENDMRSLEDLFTLLQSKDRRPWARD